METKAVGTEAKKCADIYLAFSVHDNFIYQRVYKDIIAVAKSHGLHITETILVICDVDINVPMPRMKPEN